MDELISRQATIDAMEGVDWYHIDNDGQLTHGANSEEHEPLYKAKDVYAVLNTMQSAQPEKRTDKCTETHACDCISRQAVIEINRSYHGQMPNEVNHRIWEEINELPSAQPDMSEYSDKLWKAAYERGKAEAQAEIVRCKDCKHRTSYWGNCRLLEEKYHQSVLVDGDSFCSMAERRTDDCV